MSAFCFHRQDAKTQGTPGHYSQLEAHRSQLVFCPRLPVVSSRLSSQGSGKDAFNSASRACVVSLLKLRIAGLHLNFYLRKRRLNPE
jgi:hypothetical protein